MKCPTINLVQLFILLFTVIETGHLANGLESISQLEKNNFKELMPEFKQQLLRWMSIKKQASKLKKSNTVDIEYLDCALCRASVESVQFLTGIHMDNAVIGIIRNFCIYLHIETVNVCEGIVESFKEEFILIAKNVDLSSGQICSISLGSPCHDKIDPRLNWTLPLPEKPTKQEPTNRLYPLKKANGPNKTYKFLQISDTHVDLNYQVNTNAACNEPLCCRSKSRSLYSRSLDLDLKRKAQVFGIKLSQNDELTAGRWGSYGNCDVPMDTFKQALKQIMAKHSDELDYIIWTGDVPPHDVWRQSRQSQIEMIKKASEQFMKYLNETPVYPALGNHEGFPVNNFPPKNIVPSHPDINMDWLYDPLNDIWGKWIGTTSSIRKGAYYSIKAKKNLRIISLNTNYCNDENWWLLINSTDPENELTWLINQLADAEKLNEKVHIIGHIPPGKSDCLQIWSENYYRIVSRFKDTIMGQFYGHTHSDEFEIFFDHDQLNLAKSTENLTEIAPVSIAYLAPSITTFVGSNPGYRIYEVDANTFEVINYHNYFLDLPTANRRSEENPNYAPEFEYSYNPIDHYNLKDLSAQSWLNLTERMFKNLTLLNEYLYLSKNKASSSAMVEMICGDDQCKKLSVCQTLNGKSHDDQLCDYILKRFKSN